VVGVREDVEVVPPDRPQDLLADLVRVHPGLVEAREDAHELFVGGRHVRRQLLGPDQPALVDLALDEAGADHRHADPVRQQAPSERIRQAVHGELRCRVDPRPGAGHERRHRRGVHDVTALAVRLDPGDERHDAVDDAAEVDAEHPVPVLVRRVGDVVEQVDAGVVAEHVHVPERALRLVGGAGERLPVGHVQPDREDVAAERRRRLLEMVGPHVGDRDVHAGGEERPGHAEADPAPASRDEGDPAFDVAHRRRAPYRLGGAHRSVGRRHRWRRGQRRRW
jgi:hypothetical protein